MSSLLIYRESGIFHQSKAEPALGAVCSQHQVKIQGAVPGGDAFRPAGLAVGVAMLGAGKAVGSGQMVEF